MSAHTTSPGMPRLFRTYESAENQDYNCTIWEAACATTASPLFFEPIRIGPKGMQEPFVAGSLGCNNPLDVLFEEALRVFPDRRVACVISLGAGYRGPTSSLVQDVREVSLNIASDCEATANDAELRFKDVSNVYFRFNATQRLDAVENKEQDQAVVIKSSTESYLLAHEVVQKMVSTVTALASRNPGSISTRQLRA